MHISFSPFRCDHVPSFERHGDTISIDGDVFDFAFIPEGGVLPSEAVASDWICGDISRHAGMLHLTLMLPHGPDASAAERFPGPIYVTEDGPIQTNAALGEDLT